ncbi:MAG: hypothetical protein KGY66_04985 [Candidatus Thermoplasmatota archaeon]|nr:hypothetical protein [Candidatus Thermoplasmatota archaeon]MBS3790252.1 hypothetical protein [Candidatus Thermoplasmatota archaeon]
MDKNYALLGTIWVIVIVAALITYSFLPGYVREKGDLYEPFEYSQMYLENESYSDLIIEYDYVAGHEPSETAMTILEEKVKNYTDKETVESVVDDQIGVNDTRIAYDKNDISELKESYQDHGRRDNKISMHVLYLNGVWKENENALGLAKRPYQIVIFDSVIEDLAERNTNLTGEDIEGPVVVHEFGHLLSLVGLSYESEHEDTEYSGHCDESKGECVMAGTVEVKENMGEAPPSDFCDLCIEDMEYIREMEDSFGFEDLISYLSISGQYLVGIWISTVIIGKSSKNRKYRPHQVGPDRPEQVYQREERAYSDPDQSYDR